MEIIQQSAHTIHHEVMWFERVVDTALTLYFKNESEFDSIYAHQPPEIDIVCLLYTSDAADE